MIPRILLLLLLATHASAYKILVYNMRFGHSHSNYLGRIADILADAGHNVTTLAPIITPEVSDGTTKSRIITVPQSKSTAEFVAQTAARTTNPYWDMKADSLIGAYFNRNVLNGFFCDQCNATANHPGLLEELRAEKFDVFINENFDFCGIGFAHAIAPKSTIIVSTSTLFDNVAYDLGIPVMPSFNPAFTSSDLEIHSIWSRAKNIVRSHLNLYIWGGVKSCADAVFRKKFGSDYPDITNQTGEAAFVFTNSEPLIDFARPLLRKVVDLGGIGLTEPKKLNEHWNKILSLRTKTVLVSFGSMAKSITMSDERKHAMLKAFAAFPDVTFIWKYEEPEDVFCKEHVAKVKNVVISKWTPQNDLLNDPRMTAFISHAGMGSCQEAAARGVPGLFMPLFGDQPRNAAMMDHNGIGIAFSKHDAADSEKLTEGIRRLLNTESLRTNSKRISKMLAKKPFSPRELLIKHVEFAAEFGPSKALTPRGLQLGWIQYFLIDILAISMVVAGLVLALIAYVSVIFFKKCFGRPVKSKQS